MKIVQEFREFIMRGNVVDLAVGIIIGAAFGKIVSSFVADVLMPPLGLLLGGMDFSDMKILLKPAVLQGDKIITPAVTINYGIFVTVVIDFLIVAFAVFMLVKLINSLHRKKAPVQSITPPPTAEQTLLTEIRDLLKSK